MSKLLERIAVCKLEGSLLKFYAQIEKTQLLILDDFGLQPLDATSRLVLLQILEDRYGRKSTIITSQLPVGIGTSTSTNQQLPMQLWTDCQLRLIVLNSRVNL